MPFAERQVLSEKEVRNQWRLIELLQGLGSLKMWGSGNCWEKFHTFTIRLGILGNQLLIKSLNIYIYT